MKYYNNNGNIQAFYSEGAVEIENPVREDGTLLPNHKNLSQVETKEDGSYYTYYNVDGTPDIAKETEEATQKLIANYKSLYLGEVDKVLAKADYDSLATVKLWENDDMFGAEATAILAWYKALIAKNYELLNEGVMLTDEEYLAQLPVYS